ncbi:MAG: ATP-binding protein [bacterium]
MTDAQKSLNADTHPLPLPPENDNPYQQLLDTVCDAVLISTVTGDVTDANLSAAAVLLYDVEELRRMSIASIIAIADANLLPAILTGLDTNRHVLLEATCTRKDGSRFPGEIAVSRIHNGDKTRLFLFIRDLTVHKQTETALRETLSRLEMQDRARALLVSNVTHELRTPLTSIIYGLSNLLSGVVGPVTPPVRQYLERFNREGQRLLSTVEDILYLERIETKTLRLSSIMASVPRLVARAIAALELSARHKHVTVNRDYAADAMFTCCDPAKMNRVLVNIIGNAIKYTPGGGTVTISLVKHPGKSQTLSVRIEDTGVGIPPHAISSVTDRYYRVGDQADGAGLGLAIAKDIIEMHSGSIQIASPPPGRNAGTLVSINIPLVDQPDLLVLSTDAATTQRVMEQLIPAGYNVSAVTGSKEAMDLVRDKHVDLLIVNIPLQDSDGTGTIAAIHGSEYKRRIPIVVITAGDLSTAQKEIFSCLSIPILKKPWQQDELLDGIERAFLASAATAGEEDL